MRYIMFQPQFEKKILDGVKTSTIRKRAHPPGEKSLRVWTGKPYRSKQRQFALAHFALPIQVSISHMFIRFSDGQTTMTEHGANSIAKQEGFEHYGEMVAWFRETHGLPFDGYFHSFGLFDPVRDKIAAHLLEESNRNNPFRNLIKRSDMNFLHEAER